MEEHVADMEFLVAAMPIARTPWDRNGASSLDSYQKQLMRNLKDSLPWVKEKRDQEIRDRLKKPPIIREPIEIPD
jgi:hypothetical protein